MKTFKEDKNLKTTLKSIKLDSPELNFTVRVMNKIFQENSILEKIKNERIFGKGFWIILALFAGLIVAMVLYSSSEANTGRELTAYLPEVNSDSVKEGYQTFFNKLGTVPLSIAGILLASSILLFIERLLNSKIKVLTK